MPVSETEMAQKSIIVDDSGRAVSWGPNARMTRLPGVLLTISLGGVSSQRVHTVVWP